MANKTPDAAGDGTGLPPSSSFLLLLFVGIIFRACRLNLMVWFVAKFDPAIAGHSHRFR